MEADYSWRSIKGSTYRAEPVLKRYGWWIALAVFLSILLHLALFYIFGQIKVLERVEMFDQVIQLQNRERLTVDEETLKSLWEEDLPEVAKPDAMIREMPVVDDLPPELPAMEDLVQEIRLTPEVEKLEGFFQPEQTVSMAAMTPQASRVNIDAEVRDEVMDRERLLEQTRVSPNQPELQISEADIPSGMDTDDLVQELAAKAGGSVAGQINANFTGLDELLQQGDQLGANERAMMPTDLVFGFNEYEVKEHAKLSLMKLGMIILNNPRATFIIEGHTDSIGSVEYNRDLSKKRAEAVKEWLVTSLLLQGYDIRTVGHGYDKPLVAPTGDRDAEALNRRVEITIRNS